MRLQLGLVVIFFCLKMVLAICILVLHISESHCIRAQCYPVDVSPCEQIVIYNQDV